MSQNQSRTATDTTDAVAQQRYQNRQVSVISSSFDRETTDILSAVPADIYSSISISLDGVHGLRVDGQTIDLAAITGAMRAALVKRHRQASSSAFPEPLTFTSALNALYDVFSNLYPEWAQFVSPETRCAASEFDSFSVDGGFETVVKNTWEHHRELIAGAVAKLLDSVVDRLEYANFVLGESEDTDSEPDSVGEPSTGLDLSPLEDGDLEYITPHSG